MSSPEKEQLGKVDSDIQKANSTINSDQAGSNVSGADAQILDNINKEANLIPLFIMLGAVAVLLIVFIVIKVTGNKKEVIPPYELTYSQAEIATAEDFGDTVAGYIKDTAKDVVNERYENTVFVGDSLTEGLSYYGYQEIDHVIAERGTSIEQAMKKIKKIAKPNPDYIFVMLGINDLNYSIYTLDDIEDNYIKLIEKLHDKMPNAKIYAESLLPVTKNFAKSHKLLSNKRINTFNKRIKKIAGKYDYVTYLDVHSKYVTSKGCLSSKISSDGYHLQPDAYEKWVKLVKETLKNDK